LRCYWAEQPVIDGSWKAPQVIATKE